MSSRTSSVALLLFVSGLCALVFQAAWFREFRLIFGSSTPASAAVLAIFMGGLGLGNALLGRRADKIANPLRLYSTLEIGISLFCGVSPFLVQLVRAIYLSIGGQETLGIFGATLVRLLLSALVLGLPTFLMGGTLPAAAKAVTDANDHSRRGVGLLYGLNTLGAVCGVLLSTFFLLEILGTRATLWAACAVNLLNALAAWKLAQGWQLPSAAESTSAPKYQAARPEPAASKKKADKERRESATAIPSQPAPTPIESSPLAPLWLLYFSAGLVGFVFFLMELVWYRMLGPILGGSTFTFGLILAVALAGIGIGGALYPALFRDRRPDLRTFALTLGWEALAIALPFALGDRLAVLAQILRGLSLYGFYGQALGWLAITLMVVFPAALASGIQFPVLIALIGQGSRDVGKQLGLAFGWNTVGAMAGSLTGGFGLVSLLTAPGVWKLSAIVLGGFAVVVLFIEFVRLRQVARLVQPLAVVAVAALCLLAIGPTAVWRHNGIGAGRAPLVGNTQHELRNFLNNSRRHIVWQADGRESTVAISAQNGIAFIVNGKSDGNAISDAGTQIMLGVLGALLHPDPHDALIVGLGTGESAGWLASLPQIERVDVVELEPAIQEVARQCGPMNHRVLEHPKVHLTLSDAREVLQTTRRKYDLIASEPSNPYRTGVASLYTREFYEAANHRLNERGIFIQWLQGYEVDLQTIRTVTTTLGEVFPHVEIWETNPSDLVLVCSQEPLDYRAADLQARIAEPAMREALRVAWRTQTMEGVLAHLVADGRYAQAVIAQGNGDLNTDDKNLLEYSFARTVGRPGGFSIDGLRKESVTTGTHRPAQLAASVDWERVEDARLAGYAVSGETPLPAEFFSGDRRERAESFIAQFQRGNTAEAIKHWNSQPQPPRELCERLALALAYANEGDAQASSLIESIRRHSPRDAEALAAILAARSGQIAPAIQQFRQLFLALRDDPTPTRRVIDLALLVASQTVEKHPEHSRTLYESLEQPLSVAIFEDRRCGLLTLLGQRLGGREFTSAMLQLEPYPPWDGTVLTARVQAYQQTQHPLLARAQRELDEYRRSAPQAAVLQIPQEQANPNLPVSSPEITSSAREATAAP
jgi:spermidine synthase/MFS family permease